jgi:hypothetical protein
MATITEVTIGTVSDEISELAPAATGTSDVVESTPVVDARELLELEDNDTDTEDEDTVATVDEEDEAKNDVSPVEGDGWTMAVNIDSPDGAVEETEAGAVLKLVRDETALVSGSGFMAGTRADVWLFSEPTLVGTVSIDENGEFTGEVDVDPNLIPAGEHTLQLQGVGTDGYVKAANLGVLVEDAGVSPRVIEESGFSWTFLWWILLVIVLLLILWFVVRRRRSGLHA